MEKKQEINPEFINILQETAISVVRNELASHYLLGETEEYDNFEPDKVNIENATAFEIYKVACCRYVGYKTAEDESSAEKLWFMSAEMGDDNAMLEYSANMFEQGQDEKGYKMLTLASKKGNKMCAYRLALCNIQGIGCKMNEEKGVKYMQALAENDFADAVYFISTLYSTGGSIYIKRDEIKGEALLKNAYELGSKLACTDYCIKKLAKVVKDEDKKKLMLEIEKSAEDGDVRAMTIMSIAYAKGDNGLDVDIEKSKKFLALAYDAKFPMAVKIVEEAKNFLKQKGDIDSETDE